MPADVRSRDLFEGVGLRVVFEWDCNNGFGSIKALVEAFQRGRCGGSLIQMCVSVSKHRRREMRTNCTVFVQLMHEYVHVEVKVQTIRFVTFLFFSRVGGLLRTHSQRPRASPRIC